MTRPRVYKTEAVVLKQTPLGEADRLLTLYTPYMGKLRAVARGVRRPRSRLGGNVGLLIRGTMMLSQGKSLDIITQGQTVESFQTLRSDLWRLTCGLYAAELVDQFTPERVENRPLYQLLLDTLHWLEEVSEESPALRYFELHLLEEVGYRPELQRCVFCRSPLSPTTNFFAPSGGGTLCPKCQERELVARPLTLEALKVMRFLQDADLPTAKRLKISPALSVIVEGVLRGYIWYLLEREVKSAAFLDTLRRGG